MSDKNLASFSTYLISSSAPQSHSWPNVLALYLIPALTSVPVPKYKNTKKNRTPYDLKIII